MQTLPVFVCFFAVNRLRKLRRALTHVVDLRAVAGARSRVRERKAARPRAQADDQLFGRYAGAPNEAFGGLRERILDRHLRVAIKRLKQERDRSLGARNAFVGAQIEGVSERRIARNVMHAAVRVVAVDRQNELIFAANDAERRAYDGDRVELRAQRLNKICVLKRAIRAAGKIEENAGEIVTRRFRCDCRSSARATCRRMKNVRAGRFADCEQNFDVCSPLQAANARRRLCVAENKAAATTWIGSKTHSSSRR